MGQRLHRGVESRRRGPVAALAIALGALAATPARAAELSFLYTLSDANGRVPTSWARLAHDAQANETFVVDAAEGIVRVFNRAGMETYSFGDDDTLGAVSDLGVLEAGDLVVLAHRRGQLQLLRCDFRGAVRGRIELRGLPAEYAALVPDRLRVVDGTLYLASSQAMRVVAVTADGAFVRGYDASGLVGGRKAGDAGFTGFGVDGRGNVLFTVAPLFQAFVLSPGGELRGFGVRGSSPGKFNVVGGIAADADGNLYVTDVLRSVVMVFDAAFEFQGEVGYRGDGPGNLIAPRDLVVGDGQVFVTQSAARGVSVFRIEASRGAARST